jgi:hypothetical protein
MKDPHICNQCPLVAPQAQPPLSAARPGGKGKRGGRRPGAGAPVGNLSHLKSGNRSKIVQLAISKLAADPDLRVFLLMLTRISTEGTLPATTRKLIQEALEREAIHA